MLAVPVLIELFGHLRHDRADRHHVEIGEGEIRVRVEILVADVAASDDRDLVVHGEGLAVHAVIHRSHPGQKLEVLRMPAFEGIEQPHLDGRMRIERGPDVVGLSAVHVVDQQAHPHAPVGRGQELPDQEPADGVLMKHVVLHVDAAFAQARQLGTSPEGIPSVAQKAHARLTRMLLQPGAESLAEAGALAVAEGARRGFPPVVRSPIARSGVPRPVAHRGPPCVRAAGGILRLWKIVAGGRVSRMPPPRCRSASLQAGRKGRPADESLVTISYDPIYFFCRVLSERSVGRRCRRRWHWLSSRRALSRPAPRRRFPGPRRRRSRGRRAPSARPNPAFIRRKRSSERRARLRCRP